MKLIYAIIRYDNEDDVTTSLTKHKVSNDHQSCITFFQESTGSRKTCKKLGNIVLYPVFSCDIIKIRMKTHIEEGVNHHGIY